MNEWERRIVLSLTFVAGLIATYIVVYQWAMAYFVDESISLVQSAQVVIEALTTAGFGGDTEAWRQHDALAFVVIVMNLSGVLLVFLAVPVFLVPLFKQAVKDRPRESTDLTDHVIICSFTPREDVLRGELDAAGIPYVVIEEDPETVIELNSDGVEAILGDLEQDETYRAANVGDARAIVTDVSDDRNVSVILTARECGEDIRVISVSENEADAIYQRYAGADQVIRPRQVLGRSLAERTSLSLTKDFHDTVALDEDFELSELLVKEHSDLAGRTLAEAGLRDQMGVTVIGMWVNGEFLAVPEPDTKIDSNTILLVAGSPGDIEEVSARTVSPNHHAESRVVVAGYGVVGQSAVERLEDSGLECTVVDSAGGDGVDVVGSITDPETLSEARVETAESVVLALDDDTATMYTTVALERIAPDTEVIVRANDIENTRKLYRAGAEYVLALSSVTGRMLASILLEDEEVLAPSTQFELVRRSVPSLAGRTLGEADVRERTGATVVAVERNGELVKNPGPEFAVEPGDTFIVAGDDDAVNNFVELGRS